MTNVTPPLRVVVIGTRGQAARVAVPTIALSERADLVGVIGSEQRRTREFADELGVTSSPSISSLAQDGVDAVWLTAPNHLHATMASELLESGVNVLLEKPMTTTLDDATSLREVVARTEASATLRVAYQHRFRPAHQLLRHQLRSGELGESGMLRVHRYWKFPYFAGDDPSGPAPWRSSSTTSGGWAINDIGSHLVDLVLWMTQPQPLTVVSAVFGMQFPGVDNDSSALLTLGVGDRGLAVIECSNALSSPGSLVEYYSGTAWARLTNSFHPVAVSTTSLDDMSVTTTSDDSYLRMFDDFVAACHGEPSEGATADEAWESVRLIQEARATGRYLAGPA